ncbi:MULTISPECIES: PTS mannose/fructose/sorbose/N-acetylgalactosamine transporter subunit IIC [Bacteria]|uniref:PTS mannose/fructose/sorbose/N-acetylgalactosamine transporter subunit IIC n=1 Tax=Bacteria TaxID=2 RepID=UPI000A339E92|nr:PTS sugar transporter subunit IIC [Enterococcus faecium]EGP5213204.1 PTS sugar transporter subunit IIC [Enterococcus faecium]MDN3079571.1 PTS sugar transporter subunit IIC [Enterococcus faecium]MDQ8216142.1 PTS sugar transporter subunit IIC [Enterococcus faecium]MDQ8230895.1 PTS sugar transporter subunit IIC [Enterococcus faecium]MDQ8233289.1 PTS sugar transporter subunit IIC [Enterococcus faecium]
MEISFVQSLLIALVTAFCYSGQLLGIYTNRALVMSFFVGVILGDIPTALTFGALAELAYMGFGVGAGGTVPPNPVGPGIVGTIMAITLQKQGVTPQSALALSFPFAVLFQLVTTALYTLFSGSTKWSQKAIDEGNYKKYSLIANSTYIGFAVTGFIIGLAAAISRPGLQAFVEALPEWLISGFSVAGGLIPAIGFAMILSVMLEKHLIPFVLLGYICVSYLALPTMAIALMGAVFALIQYYSNDKNTRTTNGELLIDEEDFSNGI